MAQTQSKPSKPTTGAPRLYDLDNFRSYLTALVIYHHTAVSYGGVGTWAYLSRFHTPNSSLLLMSFNATNQSYFMGSFFFLSGYFSSRALSHKTPTSFLRAKFVKLGLPTLALTLFGGPAQTAIVKFHSRQPVGINVLLNHWRSLRGIKGSVWYLGLVLVFDTLYAFSPRITAYTSRLNLSQTLILDVASSFLIRIFYPVGTVFAPLNLQPAYLPQYVASYLLGASLAESSPSPLSPTSRNALLASSMLSAGAAISLLRLYPGSYNLESLRGGMNLAALSYAVWNESTGYLLATAIRDLFQRKRTLNRRWGDVGRYSYAAFLVHGIVVIGVQSYFDGWKVGGVLKTGLLGTLSVLGSWGVGWGLVRIPGVGSVLV